MVIMNIEECERNQSITVSIYYPGCRLQMLGKTIKHLDHEKLRLAPTDCNKLKALVSHEPARALK